MGNLQQLLDQNKKEILQKVQQEIQEAHKKFQEAQQEFQEALQKPEKAKTDAALILLKKGVPHEIILEAFHESPKWLQQLIKKHKPKKSPRGGGPK